MTETTTKSHNELKSLAEKLINEQSTMTLATTSGDDAWAAPVYYVYQRPMFYFFSDPSSRHIQESVEGGNAASAIFCPASTWQDIRGVQMSGTIETVSGGFQALGVIRAYLKKFPFTKEFFPDGGSIDLSAFTRHFKVKLYRFVPSLVYYQDNSIRFSFRERITL